MTHTIKWGILGAGNISAKFANDLLLNNTRSERQFNHIVRSVGASKKEKASQFIEKLKVNSENNGGIKTVGETYDEFFKNPDIDIVYVGTIHPLHKEQVIKAIDNGKHVLCEKPMNMNPKETEELVKFAREKKKYLLEGVWTRFFPSITLLKKYLFEDKVLGDINRLFADFGYNSDIDKQPMDSRVRNINLGAGSLLDIGIYPLTYSRFLLDEKLGSKHTKYDIKSFMSIDPTDKVDHRTTIMLNYANGRIGILTSTELTDGPQPYLRLEGSKGYVNMSSDNPARPIQFKINFTDGSDPIEYKDTSGFHGFIYEANAVAQDILDGKLESEVMPHEESLLVANMLYTIRQQNGLVYPQDL